MTDELDPADWLASQFGEDEPDKPARRRGVPAAEPHATPPAEPAEPTVPATAVPPPLVAPPAPSGGFAWGLTPGAAAAQTPDEGPIPAPAPAPEPSAHAEPVAPAWDTPTVATPLSPSAPAAWDTPTEATPTLPDEPAPTVALSGAELARQEFPAVGVPVDPAIEGVTDVLGAQPVGLGAPRDEGPEVSAIDSLFGEDSFVEYDDALIPVLPPRASGGELVVVDRPRAAEVRAPITSLQKTLMAVAGGLVAVLLLIVLFLAGQRIGASNPAPAVAEGPTPSASAEPTTGPLPPGDYYWDRLLGGECIAPFTSPWEDTFTVVDCAQPHPAQLVLKGTFPAAEDPAYPGVDELQKLAASLCTAPTVIDYPATGGAADIQVLASFAADEQDWLNGNRTFYCFAHRTGGAEFTTSIAVPQVAATPAP